jgi:putative chitinase
MPLTAEQLAKLCPKADLKVLKEFADALNAQLENGGLNSNKRLRHFLAQCAHESAGFTRFRENLKYSEEGLRKTFAKYFDAKTAHEYARKEEKIANRVYANRLGNGNEDSGDGWRYRGRGIIQLTGRSNYKTFGPKVGADLEAHPEDAETPAVAVKVALAYWNDRHLSEKADADDVVGITKGINGGTIGLEERKALLEKAKKIWP